MLIVCRFPRTSALIVPLLVAVIPALLTWDHGNVSVRFGRKEEEYTFMRPFLVDLIHQVHQIAALLPALVIFLWQALRKKRKQLGFTIEEAAEICGVDPSTYARWERGVQKPHFRNLTTLFQKIDPDDDEVGSVPDAFLPPSYWN